MILAGGVSVDGEPTPQDTVITVLVDGQEIGRYLTTQQGSYYIRLDDAERYAGRKMIVYVGGLRVRQEVGVLPGKLLLLDLDINVSQSSKLMVTTSTIEQAGGPTGGIISFPQHIPLIFGIIILLILFLNTLATIYGERWG